MEIINIIEKLNLVFQKANDRFFDGSLEKPMITVSPDMTAGAYGWFTTWKAWEEKDGTGYYEINITAEYLDRDIHETVGTLLHEMTHMFNTINGIKDTSRGGSYHNKNFKAEAEKRGLAIGRDEKYGWTLTELNPEGEEFVHSLGIEGFDLKRTGGAKNNTSTGKGKGSSRKYVCPGCGMIVRATKEVYIICGDCDLPLELEEN